MAFVPAANQRPDARVPPASGAHARRILLLAPYPPRLDGTHGGSRAVAHLALALAERNRVALAYLRAHDEPALDDAVARRCDLVVEGRRGGSLRSSVWPLRPAALRALAPRLLAGLPLWVAARWSAELDARIRDVVERWHPDVIEAESSVMGQYLRRAALGPARLVVTFHESATVAAEERLASSGLAAPLWRLEARRWRRFESTLLSRVDAGVAFTERDAGVLRAMRPPNVDLPIEVIPLAVPVAPAPTSSARSPRRIVFVGNFAHPPNADAARFLTDEIFPPIRRRFADVELWIVGADAPRELTARAGEGVVVTGFVPDVGIHLADATIVVAPIRLGGGMRVKVLEAMAAGRAIVATSRAIDGVRATHGRELLVADDAASFRDAIAALLDDPARRDALGRAARERVVAEHSWSAAAAAYETLYARLGGSGRRAPQLAHD
jgi:glycosyltransferase involved in cell wall biosynthesis